MDRTISCATSTKVENESRSAPFVRVFVRASVFVRSFVRSFVRVHIYARGISFVCVASERLYNWTHATIQKLEFLGQWTTVPPPTVPQPQSLSPQSLDSAQAGRHVDGAASKGAWPIRLPLHQEPVSIRHNQQELPGAPQIKRRPLDPKTIEWDVINKNDLVTSRS